MNENRTRSILTLTDTQMERLKKLAEMCANSNSQLSYRKASKTAVYGSADLLIIMLKGIEVGLEPMAALEMMNVVHGKVALSPQGMLAKIYTHPDFEDIIVTPGVGQCSVAMKRVGKTAHAEIFTMDDAKSMGLLSNPQWTQQPDNMLKWRAVSACARVVFPDVIQGLYTPEELGGEVAYDDDGAVLELSDTIQQAENERFMGDDILPDPEPPTAAPPSVDVEALATALSGILTEDDGSLMNYHHAVNYVKQRVADGTVKASVPMLENVIQCVYRRGFDKLGMEHDDIAASLDCDLHKWVKQQNRPGSLAEAWQIILEAYAYTHEPQVDDTSAGDEIPYED